MSKKRELQAMKEQEVRLPTPSASFRRRAWIEFQRAIDPLAPIRQRPRPPA